MGSSFKNVLDLCIVGAGLTSLLSLASAFLGDATLPLCIFFGEGVLTSTFIGDVTLLSSFLGELALLSTFSGELDLLMGFLLESAGFGVGLRRFGFDSAFLAGTMVVCFFCGCFALGGAGLGGGCLGVLLMFLDGADLAALLWVGCVKVLRR